jgi:hypothetical protein
MKTPNQRRDAKNAKPQHRVNPNAFLVLVDAFMLELEKDPYTYFELAYTRTTGWMAWICDRIPVAGRPQSGRKIITCGQGSTVEEACFRAIQKLPKSQIANRKSQIVNPYATHSI